MTKTVFRTSRGAAVTISHSASKLLVTINGQAATATATELTVVNGTPNCLWVKLSDGRGAAIPVPTDAVAGVLAVIAARDAAAKAAFIASDVGKADKADADRRQHGYGEWINGKWHE